MCIETCKAVTPNCCCLPRVHHKIITVNKTRPPTTLLVRLVPILASLPELPDILLLPIRHAHDLINTIKSPPRRHQLQPGVFADQDLDVERADL